MTAHPTFGNVYEREFSTAGVDSELYAALRGARSCGFLLDFEVKGKLVRTWRRWSEGQPLLTLFAGISGEDRHQRSVSLFRVVLERLKPMHDRGYAHGSLHPGNLWVGADGVEVLDCVANRVRMGTASALEGGSHGAWLWCHLGACARSEPDWDRVCLLRLCAMLAGGVDEVPVTDCDPDVAAQSRAWADRAAAGLTEGSSLRKALSLARAQLSELEAAAPSAVSDAGGVSSPSDDEPPSGGLEPALQMVVDEHLARHTPGRRYSRQQLIDLTSELEGLGLSHAEAAQAVAARLGILQPGMTLDGKYRVVRLLGVGGMGSVYEVQHERLRAPAAAKILTIDLAADPELRERFESEGHIQAQLSHPNIVRVFDVLTEPVPGLLMELVSGPTLDEYMVDCARPLTAAGILAIMGPVLDAVATAHDAGIVHRDLKPANIILSTSNETPTPKVTDFGIAKVLDHAEVSTDRRKTRAGSRIGTPRYMSPEQIRGEEAVDERSDIFALGAILYEVATGKVAFDKPSTYSTQEAIVNGRFEPPDRVMDGLHPAIVDCIDRALATSPKRRFQTCRGFRAALSTALSPAGEPAVHATTRLASERGGADVASSGVGRLAPSADFFIDLARALLDAGLPGPAADACARAVALAPNSKEVAELAGRIRHACNSA